MQSYGNPTKILHFTVNSLLSRTGEFLQSSKNKALYNIFFSWIHMNPILFSSWIKWKTKCFGCKNIPILFKQVLIYRNYLQSLRKFNKNKVTNQFKVGEIFYFPFSQNTSRLNNPIRLRRYNLNKCLLKTRIVNHECKFLKEKTENITGS